MKKIIIAMIAAFALSMVAFADDAATPPPAGDTTATHHETMHKGKKHEKHMHKHHKKEMEKKAE